MTAPAGQMRQNVRRLRPKTGPKRSPARRRAAVRRRDVSHGDHREAGRGLSLQRIWQDLVEEYGYGASYESVNGCTDDRTARPSGVSLALRRSAVDFFRGALTLDEAPASGAARGVSHDAGPTHRHGYEEAVWDQKLETSSDCTSHGFRDVGGVRWSFAAILFPGTKS